jgi:23S rRNA (pseudouridine1915-N3)-methyltransferase
VKLVVLQRGRLRDRCVIELRDEYIKRFKRYGSLTIIEREAGEKPIWREGDRWKVVLDERGETSDSSGFARLLQRWTMRQGEIVFAVGDAYGHASSTIAAADAKLSLGQMTLPHQLAHLVLVEQLYRAATILAGTPYHHG